MLLQRRCVCRTRRHALVLDDRDIIIPGGRAGAPDSRLHVCSFSLQRLELLAALLFRSALQLTGVPTRHARAPPAAALSVRFALTQTPF